MLTGARLLAHVGFPATEVLGPDASEDQIQAMIDRHGLLFIKPVFRGGVGKKGKAGLIGKARDLRTAVTEKERLYFAQHRHGNATTAELVALAEQVSGQDLGEFFEVWLETPERPAQTADNGL